MGVLLSTFFKDVEFKLHVTTGDKQGAGTDAKVWIELADTLGAATEALSLNRLLVNDHERGHTVTYEVSAKGLKVPESLSHVVIWRDKSGIGDSWFLDRIEVEDRIRKRKYVFPVHRWIPGNSTRMYLYPYDAFLPQVDPQHERRKLELAEKKKTYQYQPYDPEKSKGPRQVLNLPSDEMFSKKYTCDLAKLKIQLFGEQFFKTIGNKKITALKDIQDLFSEPPAKLYRPASVDMWMDDKWFGRQRVQGVNPVLIKLCQKIPEKLPVTSKILEPFLEEKTLSEALAGNRIFIVDLELLDGVRAKIEPVLVSPIALFFLNKEDDLVPVCIQLHQKPGPDNPLYFPSDPELTWTMAKMFFNMGDAQYHQSITHLGSTHLLMEGLCIAANRLLSRSHPIYRLLAPHFLYLMAINDNARTVLLAKDGWVDEAMTVGANGLMELVDKGFKKWSLDTHGSVVKEIESRGVLDAKILPKYHYREDAVELYNAIERYVTKVVKYYYGTPEKLKEDYEIQAWCREMSLPQGEGGLGIGGMPTRFDTVEQLAQICTTIVSTSSLGHAAANFQQYDAYGFVPNYPGVLVGLPPKKKKEITEKEFLNFLPDTKTTVQIMGITHILSTKGTQSLGDFEVQYLHDPEVLVIVNEFKLDLQRLSNKIGELNKKREYPYEWLDPKLVPNAISI